SRSMATIKIPPVLRSSVGGEKEVTAAGGDVGAVLRALAEQHPQTETQLFGPDGSLNRYVNVYLNDEDVRVLGGLDTSVGESDVLVILPAKAGGGRPTSRRWRTRTRSSTGTSRPVAGRWTGSAGGWASPGSAASRAPG